MGGRKENDFIYSDKASTKLVVEKYKNQPDLQHRLFKNLRIWPDLVESYLMQ